MKNPIEPFFCTNFSKTIEAEQIHIVGFEFDETASFRKGTVLGPNAIREISDQLESYSSYLDKDLNDFQIKDIGNLGFENKKATFEEMTQELYSLVSAGLKQDARFVLLGGEHSVPYGTIKAYLEKFNNLVLLHLDAHADLRDGYNGYHYSHASIMRRCHDHFGADHILKQWGIRSGTKDEFVWMRENNTLLFSIDEVRNFLNTIPNDRPIYLSLDVDFFDPAYVPGTGTPEAGGETFSSFISMLKILQNKNFVGADIVELSPEIDGSGNSTVFVSKVLRETLLAMVK